MTEQGQSKAEQYISLLDEVRCNGDWKEVPEITRKLKKHAPARKCLIETARAEYAVASLPKNRIRKTSGDLHQLIPILRAAISAERVLVEDVLQAQVCLAWLYWTLGETSLALASCPQDLSISVRKRCFEWTRVCAIKGYFITGDSYEREGRTSEALRAYESVLLLISQSIQSRAGLESRKWMDRLLRAYCLLSSKAALSSPTDLTIAAALTGFRIWARMWEGQPGPTENGSGGSPTGVDRSSRHLWGLYHTLLSTILQRRLQYPPPSAYNDDRNFAESKISMPKSFPSRIRIPLQQRNELWHVQDIYESLLFAEVPFPKAHEFNEEIQRWVEVVMGNWKFLCESTRTDGGLSEENNRDVGQDTLKVLYRAAAKSFHSTPILRHLFAVHASLGEYHLALRALETYLELVQKGRARVAKSGKSEPTLDDDGVLIETAAEGIRHLCSYGGQHEATKARDIGARLEKWLEELDQQSRTSAERNINDVIAVSDEKCHSRPKVSKHVVSAAYRAVGISQAHWARTTSDADSRQSVRERALRNIRKSLSVDYGDSENPDSLFALGLILAESREINKALVIVKRALLPQAPHIRPTPSKMSASDPSSEDSLTATSSSRFTLKYLPLWHLLILLLSATQKFDTALDLCEAVVERSITTVRDTDEGGSSLPLKEEQQDNLAGSQEQRISEPLRSIDNQEKGALLQIKMTQLALLEIIEDSEAAVNASRGLLELYSKMYGFPAEVRFKPGPLPTIPNQPPKSSAGTLRSLKGSLFGKSRSSRLGLLQLKPAGSVGSASSSITASRSPAEKESGSWNGQTNQPTDSYSQKIDDRAQRSHHGLFSHTVGRSHSRKLHKRAGSLKRAASAGTLRLRKELDPRSSLEDDSGQFGTDSSSLNGVLGHRSLHVSYLSDSNQQPQVNINDRPTRASQIGLAVSQGLPSPAGYPTNNEAQALELSMGGVSQAAHSSLDTEKAREPDSSEQLEGPRAHFLSGSPSREEGRLSGAAGTSWSTIHFVKVWLLVASLYRRAGFFEDAKAAVDEASLSLESSCLSMTGSLLIGMGPSSYEWSEDRCVNEMRAGVLAERGCLALAQSNQQDALAYFEQAVSCCMDHLEATVGLCNALLDISSTKRLGPFSGFTAIMHNNVTPVSPVVSSFASSSIKDHPPSTLKPSSSRLSTLEIPEDNTANARTKLDEDSAQSVRSEDGFLGLDQLAARDRAYALLLSLTKLGTGWDSSGAWFTLARAYEESGQMGKAREVLWWCIELEDTVPIRHWRNAEAHGYVL